MNRRSFLLRLLAPAAIAVAQRVCPAALVPVVTPKFEGPPTDLLGFDEQEPWSLPAGLKPGTVYYVRSVSANSFTLRVGDRVTFG